MDKKNSRKTRKSGTVKSVKDLPLKALNVKHAKGVRGGKGVSKGAGKVTFQDIHFTAGVNKASP